MLSSSVYYPTYKQQRIVPCIQYYHWANYLMVSVQPFVLGQWYINGTLKGYFLGTIVWTGAGVHLSLYDPHCQLPSLFIRRQMKQKSVWHVLQTICLQPLACSMAVPQLGQRRIDGHSTPTTLVSGAFWICEMIPAALQVGFPHSSSLLRFAQDFLQCQQ